jgi:hypothetical protein
MFFQFLFVAFFFDKILKIEEDELERAKDDNLKSLSNMV